MFFLWCDETQTQNQLISTWEPNVLSIQICLYGQNGFVYLMESKAFEFKSHHYRDRLYGRDFALQCLVEFLSHKESSGWISTQKKREVNIVSINDVFLQHNIQHTILSLYKALNTIPTSSWRNSILKLRIGK